MGQSLSFLEKAEELYKKISDAKSIHEAADVALKSSIEIFNADLGLIGFWDDREEKLSFVRYLGAPFVSKGIIYGEGMVGKCLREERNIVTQDYSLEDYALPDFKKTVKAAMAGFLGRFGPARKGVLVVARNQAKPPFSEEEKTAFFVITKMVGDSLRSLELFSLMKHTEKIKRIVTESIKKMLSEFEEINIIYIIISELLNIFDAQYSAFHRWDEKKKLLVPIITQGFEFQLPPALPGEGVAGRAFSSGKAVIAKYFPRDLDPSTDRIAKLVKDLVSSAMSVPINVSGKIIGTISVGRGKYKPPFTEEDLETLKLIGSIIETVIVHARLREKERLQMERFNRIQRLEALGTLAGGIAHDFNNILNAISGLTELALAEIDNKEALKEYLGYIKDQVFHGASLVKQILDFARKGPSDKRPLDLLVFLKEFIKFIRRTFPSSILIKFEAENGRYLVFADPTQIQQMLLNLCINAKDAMPEGGELTIALKTTNITSHEILKNGEYVVVEVKDTGCGMDEATLDKVFEPFFTTKPEGKGSGLGLPQAYGIAQQHGGTIEIESQLGKGTIVRIFLPKAEVGGTKDLSADTDQELPRGKGELILVVDDDEASLTICRKMLELLGYKVVTAKNAEEGVKLYEKLKPQVVIADIVMPGLSGTEMAKKIKQKDPFAKVIFVSGYSMEKERANLKEMGAIEILQKPLTYTDLASAVKKALQLP